MVECSYIGDSPKVCRFCGVGLIQVSTHPRRIYVDRGRVLGDTYSCRRTRPRNQS